MSYDNIYNATLDEVKEGTLIGREPTTSNVALYVGGDTINLDVKKMDEDRINKRNFAKTKIFNSIPQINKHQITTNKEQLNNESLYDRNNPEILNAFKNNQFTQSLNSVY